MLRRAGVGRGSGRLAGTRGVTLIELMVTLFVMGVVAALAAPALGKMLGNFRVRTGAESVLHGIHYARGEAVRRNSAVRFRLTGSGTGWAVEQVAPALVLQSRADSDSPGMTASSSNAALGVSFLPTGLVDTSGTWLTQVTVSSSVSGADSRRIQILGGGMVRMCDPAVTDGNDPRSC